MAYTKKTAEQKAELRKEKQYDNMLELQSAIDKYFLDFYEHLKKQPGAKATEFSLARHLGVTSRTLRKWCTDDENPQRRFLVQSAYDRLTEDVINGSGWNGKFQQQMQKQVLESNVFAGYNTRVDVKSDNTVHVVFGKGADADCMK